MANAGHLSLDCGLFLEQRRTFLVSIVKTDFLSSHNELLEAHPKKGRHLDLPFLAGNAFDRFKESRF